LALYPYLITADFSPRLFFVLLPSSAGCPRPAPLGRGPRCELEWNLFGPRWFLGLTAGGRLGPRSEELDPLRYDLRSLALAAAVFALKFSRAEPAFNVNLPPSGEILCTGFSELSENHNVVPFNTLLLLTLFVPIGLIGRYRETNDRLTGRQMPQLRIASKMSDNHRSI
jgi:hypothetical protein